MNLRVRLQPLKYNSCGTEQDGTLFSAEFSKKEKNSNS